MSAVDVFGKAFAQSAVVAERREGRRRESVDGIRADEFFDIDDIAVVWILRACARPEQSLALCAGGHQPLPAEGLAEFAKSLIDELCIGDGTATHEPINPRGLGRGRRFQFAGKQAVNSVVDSADKETGDTGYSTDVLASLHAFFQSVDEGGGHGFIGRLRKKQGHVDVDALANELANGEDTFRGRRNLDHDVLAIDGLPETPCFLERSGSIVRE